jgi:hypothetical protein
MSAAQAPDDDRALATSRTVAATPAAVFDAIRDPARLARWWGPAGFRNHFSVFEFPMARKIFVNLPIKNMERSQAFFRALGFSSTRSSPTSRAPAW